VGPRDPVLFLTSMLVTFTAIVIHEFAHAKFADLAGDPTPRYFGRVTLNPLRHLDPIGSIMIVVSSLSGFGIGWGKPCPVNPSKMRNPRWDHFISVIAGPLSNLLQAVVYALVLRILIATRTMSLEEIVGGFDQAGFQPNILGLILFYGVIVNIGLFVFNMIPIGPLDGHWLVGTFLPERQRLQWYQFNRGLGSILFLLLVLVPSGSQFDILGRFMWPIVMRIFEFFVLGT
jgi:Zn-dependent protease